MFDMPTDRQAALIAFDMQARGEVPQEPAGKPVGVPSLAPGVQAEPGAARRLAAMADAA